METNGSCAAKTLIRDACNSDRVTVTVTVTVSPSLGDTSKGSVPSILPPLSSGLLCAQLMIITTTSTASFAQCLQEKLPCGNRR